MERDLVAFVKEHLAELQSFDTVAIYYDGGQNAVRSAIRNAFDETLSVFRSLPRVTIEGRQA